MIQIRTFKVCVLMVVLLAPCFHATAQDWGPLQGSVEPTSVATHDAIVDLCNAGLGLGMAVPPVAGSAGSTTVGGTVTLQFDISKLDPNINYSGFTACSGSTCKIAFDISTWTSDALIPPIDASILVGFVATAYHELAHVEYSSFFSGWCSSHSAACQSFASCITTLTDINGNNLGYNVNTNNPCAEAYANGNEASRLCDDKLSICGNSSINEDDKAALLESIDSEMTAASEKCNSQSEDCDICGGPDMPSTFAGCRGECDCSE